MTKLKCWKKSQTSSGFYKKSEGKLPVFLKFIHTEGNGSSVVKKVGLGDKKERELGKFKSYSKATKFANKYMKEHDRC